MITKEQSAVFSGTAVVSNKLAAVPVVITGMELAKQTPDSSPSLCRSALLRRWRPTGSLSADCRLVDT